jgi:hypothetical protein
MELHQQLSRAERQGNDVLRRGMALLLHELSDCRPQELFRRPMQVRKTLAQNAE